MKEERTRLTHFGYSILWSFFNIIKPNNTPVFVLTNRFHYELIENILPYLKTYVLLPTTEEAKKYLLVHNIPYQKQVFFPKFILACDFIENDPHVRTLPYFLKKALFLTSVKKIQLYHGVLDKGWTYSQKNNQFYDLLLVTGNYALKRLLASGIKLSKIKRVGYPKLDHLDKKNSSSNKNEKKTVLYAPTWGLISSLPFLLKEIMKLSKEYTILFKPHNYSEWYYERFLRENGIEVIREEKIESVFARSDILVSDSSGIMFEFLLTKKPAICMDTALWLQNEETLNSSNGPEVMFRDLFYRVKNPSQLRSTLVLALKEYRFGKKQKEILNELFYINNSSAGKRAAAEIESFIQVN